jgi:raffinose/stachyose/melibiose transport system substrate-binding protein
MRTDAIIRSTLTRRSLLAATGLTGLSAALAACSADDDLGTDDEGGNGEAAAATGTLSWWHIQDFDPLLTRWTEVVEEYQESQSNVTLDVTPYNNDIFKPELDTAMQGDTPPDMFQSWGGGFLQAFADAGLVQPLPESAQGILGNFHEHALTPYTLEDGQVYGLPFNMGMVGIWYNQALFDQAGISAPPATWAEFLEAVQALKGAGITPIALGGQSLWPGHYWWTYLAMRTAGVDGVQAAAENQSIDAPEFVRAGELLQELIALEPFQPGFLSAEYDTEDGQAALVATGQAAMELMGHWAPVVQADSSGTDGLGDDLAFMPFPAVDEGPGTVTENLGGGDGIAFGRDADPEALADFLNFFFEPERYSEAVATGGALSVMPEADDAVESPHQQLVLEELANQTEFQLYLDQDFPAAVGDEVNAQAGALFAGETDPQGFVDSVTQVWQRQ